MNNIFPLSVEHIQQKLSELERLRRHDINKKIENISDPDIREILKEMSDKAHCKCTQRMMGHE